MCYIYPVERKLIIIIIITIIKKVQEHVGLYENK